MSERSAREWRRYWLIDPVDGLWKAAFHHGLRLLPIGAASAVGASLGRLLGRTVHRRWDLRARANYRRLKPEAGEAEIDAAMRAMWSNLGRSLAELSAIERFWGSGRIQVTGAEHLLAAQRAGRPFIVAALHLANWEMTGIGCVNLGPDMASIFEPTRNRFEVRLVVAARRRLTRRHPIYPPGLASVRAIYNTVVRERRGLHIHIDEPRKGRVNAPAFGRPRPIKGNIANAVRLALAADAVLIPAYAERLNEGARFRLIYEPPFPLVRTDNLEADIQTNVERLDAHIAAIILPRLAQWLLLHERLFEG
jgi:Kdo2-lipid IVA lauroyltransferase/acyltransferase